MATQVSYPGVYIEEFTPAAPIQGVGTSTAALLGLCQHGPPNKPTLLTSWDAFLSTFSLAGEKPEDTDYLWYAVRGFFDNGGKVCYVTAVSNAKPDSASLPDKQGTAALVVTARRSGPNTPPIKISVAEAHAVDAAKLFEPTATIATATHDTKSVTVGSANAAANFLGGDAVVIADANNSEPAKVARVSGSTVHLVEPLQNDYTNASLKLAPLDPFAVTFRVENAKKLVAGSVITLSQRPATGPAKTQTTVVKNVATERLASGTETYRVTVKDGINDFTLYGTNRITVQSEEFTLTVNRGTYSKTYDFLSMNPGHPNYFNAVINNDAGGLVLTEATEPPNPKPPAPTSAGTPAVDTPIPLTGGAVHDPSQILAGHYMSALDQLKGINDINMVVTPDRTDKGVQTAVIQHCEQMAERFAILDAVKGTALAAIEDKRNELESARGFAALYYPWIEVTSEKTGKSILVPPSGHVAGIYARTDNSRGVHKAPAGTEAIINGTLGVEQLLTDVEQGIINLKGINVIRVFRRGGRPVVWGARTTTQDTNWQYVNIRRLFLFLEESIQQGIRGSVFEPNNLALWQKLKRTISAFLTQQWRDGALFGETAEKAFYVRIDEALNPDSERALGRLYIEIGVRPSYPAEFIVVRIGIWQGGSEVSEG